MSTHKSTHKNSQKDVPHRLEILWIGLLGASKVLFLMGFKFFAAALAGGCHGPAQSSGGLGRGQAMAGAGIPVVRWSDPPDGWAHHRSQRSRSPLWFPFIKAAAVVQTTPAAVALSRNVMCEVAQITSFRR